MFSLFWNGEVVNYCTITFILSRLKQKNAFAFIMAWLMSILNFWWRQVFVCSVLQKRCFVRSKLMMIPSWSQTLWIFHHKLFAKANSFLFSATEAKNKNFLIEYFRKRAISKIYCLFQKKMKCMKCRKYFWNSQFWGRTKRIKCDGYFESFQFYFELNFKKKKVRGQNEELDCIVVVSLNDSGLCEVRLMMWIDFLAKF